MRRKSGIVQAHEEMMRMEDEITQKEEETILNNIRNYIYLNYHDEIIYGNLNGKRTDERVIALLERRKIELSSKNILNGMSEAEAEEIKKKFKNGGTIE